MKIGICGCGFVGNAIYQFLLNQKKLDLHINVYDKYKHLNKNKNLNTFDCVLDSDILFICLPTIYDEELKTYNMTEIDITLKLLAEHNFNGILLIKSTILPDYCSTINNLYPNLNIIHNPEFLSASSALEDFSTQTHIILGHTQQSIAYINTITDFYKNLFPNAEVSVCTSEESTLTKLACNSFYATKIQYFTELYLLCQHLKVPYTNVKHLMLKNGWISPHHTTIPGHDGQLSFGGACFPKDIKAFTQYMMACEIPSEVLHSVITERDKMRL